MPTTTARRRGAVMAIVATLLALLTGAATGPASAAPASVPDSGPYSGELTFDWPLDCPVVVAQRVERSGFPVLDAESVVELTEGGAPGNLLLEFGPAQVTAVQGADGLTELPAAVESPLLTNPAVELDRAGRVIAVGYEEWEEHQGDPTADVAETVQIIPIGWRANIATWGTWVDTWAQIGVIDGATDAAVELGVDEWTRPLELSAIAEHHPDGLVELYASAPTGESGSHLDFSATLDPATLQPHTARFDHFVAEREVAVETFEWQFDWSACAGAATVSDLPSPVTTTSTSTTAAPAGTAVIVPGFRTIHLDELPPEAHDTLALIADGGPFPYRQDGVVFENREGLLPRQPHGYYHEFTVETPGASTRGAKRIVVGDGGEMFYTDDHYDSFRLIVD